jgi:hypothetical protein
VVGADGARRQAVLVHVDVLAQVCLSKVSRPGTLDSRKHHVYFVFKKVVEKSVHCFATQHFPESSKKERKKLSYRGRARRNADIQMIDFINSTDYMVTDLASFTLYEFVLVTSTKWGHSAAAKTQEYTGEKFSKIKFKKFLIYQNRAQCRRI